MASNHEIFYAICSLFNEGEAVVSIDNAKKEITAVRNTLPDFEWSVRGYSTRIARQSNSMWRTTKTQNDEDH